MINLLKKKETFVNWLFLSLILVFSIIIVGGLTRLTNSGLSITEWELFKGILPPFNDHSWNIYFDLYKEIPQYKLLNFDMTLKEFKIIFYWEYFHRILGRIIGLFFLIPLIYFYFTKRINRQYIFSCFMIMTLILIQGFIGWFMVQSGLVNLTSVSHYRLALHLGIAVVIISSIYWLFLNAKNETNKVFFIFSKKNISYLLLIFLIFLQILLGALVSGLDAGKLYQTWPLMGNSFIPDDINSNLEDFTNLNSHSLVQFYHRNLAYFISFYILILTIYIYKKKIFNLYKSINLLLLALLLQIFLGVITLLSGLNILLASSHQISSVLLILSALNLYYRYIK